MINKDGTVVVGVKGKSGRKCYRDEQLRIRVIEKAWLKKEQRMNDNDATQIVLKDMTGKENINVTIPKPIDELLKDFSLQQDQADDEADKNSPRGDIGFKDSINNDLSDSPGPERQDPNPDERGERELPAPQKRSDERLPADNEGA